MKAKVYLNYPNTCPCQPLTGEGWDGGDNGRTRFSLPLTLTLSHQGRVKNREALTVIALAIPIVYHSCSLEF